MATIGFIRTNKLMTSPYAYEILREYNIRLKRDGKVNKLAFHRDVILPKIPEYKLISWYCFIRRTYDKIGTPNLPIPVPDSQQLDAMNAAEEIGKTIISNDAATQEGINVALNVGVKTLREIMDNPDLLEKLPIAQRISLLFQAMKAQDSRIHALGKVREDSREQAKFDRAFRNAAFK